VFVAARICHDATDEQPGGRVPGGLVTYAATALARIDAKWAGDDIDLSDCEDLDGVVDAIRRVADDDAETVLLFVEENDEWFGVLRVGQDGDPRVFVSDRRVIATSDIAGLFAEGVSDGEVVDEDPDDDGAPGDDEDETGAAIDAEPIGDPALLEDLGTSPARLVAASAAGGRLPGDVISDLAEAAGCLDVLDAVRGL
jgi:putative tRNA adenosine deaminase-associated protein